VKKLAVLLSLVVPLACATAEKKAAPQQLKLSEVTVTVQDNLAVEKLPEEVGLPRTGPLYFELDSDLLSKQSREQLWQIANYMMAEPGARIAIEGHCDERGSSEYNLALGDKRADTARAFLKRLGVPGERIEIVSFGEERPAAVGADERAFAQNRRDEFRFILDGGA
jgi:peptidoglycan-associated lipoprotein